MHSAQNEFVAYRPANREPGLQTKRRISSSQHILNRQLLPGSTYNQNAGVPFFVGLALRLQKVF